MAKKKSSFYLWAWLITFMAMLVIFLGGYLDSKAAGLGCANWPVCYGHVVIAASSGLAATVYSWFGLLLKVAIVILMLVAIIARKRVNVPLALSIVTLLVVLFQFVFHWLTQAHQLMPLVVLLNFVSSVVLVAMLWRVTLRSGQYFYSAGERSLQKLHKWAFWGLVIVFLQITLGAWTSANYAGLACPQLPFCHGWYQHQWSFSKAFQLWWPFQYLPHSAKATIQMAHRFGALVVTLVLGYIGYYITKKVSTGSIRNIGVFVVCFLLAELVLGILNVILLLPLDIEIAHKIFALLLLLAMVTLRHALSANVSRHKVY